MADTTNYRGRPKLDRLLWAVTPDGIAADVRVLSGDADLVEYVLPAQTDEFAKHPELTVVSRNTPQLVSLYFNLKDPAHLTVPHPVLGDRDLRRALVMAVDRGRIVKSALGPLGAVAVGPTNRVTLGADTIIPQIPYSPDSARAMLERLGWHAAKPGGVRTKQGRPLHFTLSVPAPSNVRMNVALLVQAALKDVGADVAIDAPDFRAYMDHVRHHRFDAALETTFNDPAPSGVRQSWSSDSARHAESSNYSGYENAAFDALVDSAAATMDMRRSRELYNRAYAMIVADAPAIFFWEPVQRIAFHKRFRAAPMRGDGWWLHLADWTVPPAERIARDSVGLVALAH